MKKIMCLVILLSISMLCTSCNISRELNELAIVTATALDIEKEKIILTNEIVIPVATAPESPIKYKMIYVQGVGDTVFEAYRNASLKFDRKLYLSHNMVLIFGDEFAKRGIGSYMDFYLNDAEPRETSYMLVAKGDKAYNLLGIDEGLGATSGDYIKGLIENYKFTSKSRILTIYEYFKYFFEYETPVLGVVQKIEEIEINKKKSQDTPSKFVLNVAGGAVFKKDTLEGYYTGDEMLGYSFMTNEINGGLIVFEVPYEFVDNKELISTKGKFTTMEIISSRTKKNIELVDGQFHLTINVRLKGMLGEETKGLRITELKVKDAIQKACSDKIKDHIRMVMDKAQKEFKIDSFAIKKLVNIKYPKLWNEVSDDWDNSVFPGISYSVNVETDMVRTGLINIPPNIEKGKER